MTKLHAKIYVNHSDSRTLAEFLYDVSKGGFEIINLESFNAIKNKTPRSIKIEGHWEGDIDDFYKLVSQCDPLAVTLLPHMDERYCEKRGCRHQKTGIIRA